jgi:CO dehydrogenase nickel-insertion accessory protein CooC1
MKIAVVGKGGSGKSAVSWLLSSYLSLHQKKKVLAVDADYNLNLVQSFSTQEEIFPKYLNECEPDFYKYLGLTELALVILNNVRNSISIHVVTIIICERFPSGFFIKNFINLSGFSTFFISK